MIKMFATHKRTHTLSHMHTYAHTSDITLCSELLYKYIEFNGEALDPLASAARNLLAGPANANYAGK